MRIEPPVAVALARAISDLPRADLAAGSAQAEAKVDGWRAVLFTRRGVVQTRSSRYVQDRFPELISAGGELGDVVLDGEVIAFRDGRPAFDALQSRSSGRAAAGVQIMYMAFDLLAVGDQDWRGRPLLERRSELLARVPAGPQVIQPVAATTDPDEAEVWWRERADLVEGVVIKGLSVPYRAGQASGWKKLRRTTTIELVVLGVTGRGAGTALVLGAPGRSGRLRPVAVSLPIPPSAQRELAGLLHADGGTAEVSGTVGGLPGAPVIRYQPVRPDTVVEVASDLAIEWGRLRHRPRWIRVRRDVSPGDIPALP